MRVVENVEVMQTVKILKGVQCNCCGEFIQSEKIDSVQQFNLAFGYSSKYDNQKWSVDLCESCIAKLIGGFKIVPDGFMSDPFYIEKFDSDHELHQDLFEKWKENGEWNYNDDNPYMDNYEVVGPCETEDYANVLLTLVSDNK